jgi:hypothetical protein
MARKGTLTRNKKPLMNTFMMSSKTVRPALSTSTSHIGVSAAFNSISKDVECKGDLNCIADDTISDKNQQFETNV